MPKRPSARSVGSRSTSSWEGLAAGLCAGFVLGAIEAGWVAIRSGDLPDLGLLYWGPIAVSLIGALVGLAFAWIGRFGSAAHAVLRGRPLPAVTGFGFALGGTLFAGCVTVARWRLYLDFDSWTQTSGVSKMALLIVPISIGLLVWAIAWAISQYVSRPRVVAGCLLIGLSACAAGLYGSPMREPTNFESLRAVETANLSKRNAASPETHPDIVLIVADTLRSDFVSIYNPDSRARTPNIDGLAREGIRFANFCAESSWTKPTFATLFSGLHPRSHSAVNRFARLPSEVVTLAEVLRDAGYYTYGTSNANPNNSSAANFDQGFLEFHDLIPSRGWLGAPWSATRLVVYQRAVEPLAELFVGVDIHHFYLPADTYTNVVIDWLRGWRRPPNVPVFLALHYMDSHDPNLGGKTIGRIMSRGWRKTAENLPSLETMLAGYAGDIELMDRYLGRLFEQLRELGIFEDAIVVFTSDHGDEFLEHGSWGHGDTLYAEQLRVPLIVKLPGERAGGLVVHGLASQIDVAATLLSLAGVPTPKEIGGNVLVDAMGDTPQSGRKYCVASLEGRGNRMESIRSDDAELIRTEATNRADFEPIEFFDLTRDPGQTTNLANTGDPRQAVLARALDETLERADARRQKQSTMELGTGLRSQLRALGYFE